MDSTIDTLELARTGATVSGEFAVARLQRLATLLAAPEGMARWTLRAWRVKRAQGSADDFMMLTVDAQVRLACVRCLEPVAAALAVERAYRLVADEAQAERLDLDVAQYDVLVGGRRFDLAGLVEDELIMALPATPHHERCELPAGAAGGAGGSDRAAGEEAGAPDDGAGRPHPFAALRRLRGGNDEAGS